MDVTVSEARDGSPARATRPAPAPTPRADGHAVARSATVRTLATALVAALSGAVAGAVVAHHDRGPAATTAATPASLAHFATPDVANIVAAVAPAVVSIRTAAREHQPPLREHAGRR